MALLCVCARLGYAEPTYEKGSDVPESGTDGYFFTDQEMNWIETRRKALSGDIAALGLYVDSLMGDDDAIADANRSYVRLYLGGTVSKHDGFDDLLRFRLRLDLPLTKQRFRLVLESDTESTESQPFEEEEQVDVDSNIESESGLNASLRYLFETERWQRLSLDWGVKVRLDPDLFARARALRIWRLNDRWSTAFSPELFWYESRGMGARYGFNIDRLIKESYLLRFHFSTTWHERTGNIYYGQSVSFFHDINNRRAVEYAVGYSAQNEDNFTVISEYFSRIRYRRNLYKGWLFYELTTGVGFQRQHDYKFNPFFGLRFEVLFSDSVDRALSSRMF